LKVSASSLSSSSGPVRFNRSCRFVAEIARVVVDLSDRRSTEILVGSAGGFHRAAASG
jgi:hypothetical protein